MFGMSDKEIKSLMSWIHSMFFQCRVVLQTSKKIIIQCPDCIEARHLTRNLRREGYSAEYKRGLKTDRYYVAVY